MSKQRFPLSSSACTGFLRRNPATSHPNGKIAAVATMIHIKMFEPVDGELVDDLAVVAAQRAKERAVTIHDDEPELVV